MEKRLHELDVHEVRAAQIGIVHDEDVAFVERCPLLLHALDDRLRGKLHRSHEDRQAEFALGDQLAGIAMVDAVRSVQRFGDHRRERGAHEGQVHLIADLLQPVLDHHQRDGIDVG